MDNEQPNQSQYDLDIDKVTINDGVMDIAWTSALGYGHLALQEIKDGSVEIDHEFMSIEFVKAVLNKLVDKYYIV